MSLTHLEPHVSIVMKKPRIVIAGAGIAGSLIASGLRNRTDCEVICLERVGEHEQGEAGTGLNIGPNAIKCLRLHLPREAEAIVGNSLPWSKWTIALTSGRPLMDLRLMDVADNAGVRIRWAELYALLRSPLDGQIAYNTELTGCGQGGPGLTTFVTWRSRETGAEGRIDDIDLLIAGDGRYSAIRQFVLGGPDTPAFLNVCLYRVLFPAGPDCPIDDYGQWFNGPNRLLAFRVPGDFIYCAGSFPIPAEGAIPEAMKQPDFLSAAYMPPDGPPSREAGYLIEAITRHADRLHWARLQEGSVTYGRKAGILLTGDAAHPMVPTLGQGATQACEDACVAVDEIRLALARKGGLADVPARVEERRAERIRFVVDLSRAATDTMLAGADPVEGTRWKTEAPFLRQLTTLYRDVPLPRTDRADDRRRTFA
ncbi:FAD-dependent oxidoreductase [Lichenihabitans psoromatis]|uniref:FAD-dependent oxidoreductase n=1 Tax=Lichenihabitans psoromatis TaxID=2528642 RepID=UPI001035F6CD|nr:FAD-dependent monooxygenase [Lichenihabitans psoromatis]